MGTWTHVPIRKGIFQNNNIINNQFEIPPKGKQILLNKFYSIYGSKINNDELKLNVYTSFRMPHSIYRQGNSQ